MIKQAEERYQALELEDRVRALWKERDAYAKTKEHRRDGKRYFFVDGPPYTTGSVHVGTARNKIIKDTILRWRRMRGYRVWDQPGYDMHGLPIEVLVERALGIKNKRQIEEEVGVAAFVEQCRAFALERLQMQTAEFRQMGVWMDWDNPYMTITSDYIQSAWWTLHRAHEGGLLVRAKRSLEWCSRCETPVAANEIEFWDETDPSIYVAFPVVNREESLLIWTTTPWTLPANLAVAVNPAFTYARVRYRRGGEEATVWVAEENVPSVMEEAGIEDFEIVSQVSGEELVGLEYEHPLVAEVPAQAHLRGDWVHRVLASDTVTKEFTGLVHIAPGHGPEDFEIGRQRGMDVISPIDETGRFTAEGGKYAGLATKEANGVIMADLETRGALFLRGEIVHRYGHCWRCNTPILYRATDQWFIQVTKIKDRMLAEVDRVVWIPDWAGSARQYDWVQNARDWTISRQRYWGIPMPIWECAQDHRRVIASADDLRGATGFREDMDLHRPWIDEVKLVCEEDGGEMRRVPDVLDVWFDSGVATWASIGYPQTREVFEKWWPSPWIVEAHDQTRGWFYSQLGAGVVAFDRSPYDSVLMHGWVWPAEGEAFSKSRGDALTPSAAAEEYGMDALRLYNLKAAPVWDDFAFHWEELRNAHRTLNILWNVHRFATLYMALDGFQPEERSGEDLEKRLGREDRWILSRLQGLVEAVSTHLTAYDLHKAARALEDFILRDLSRWYVRLVRDRTWTEGESAPKTAAYIALHKVLLQVARLLAPMSPFVAEAVYQDLGGTLPTVHMEDWPSPEEDLRDATLEGQMEVVRLFVEEVGRLRQTRNYRLRWPVAHCAVVPADGGVSEALHALPETFLQQANAKALDVTDPGATWGERILQLRPDRAALGRRYRALLPDIEEALGRADPAEVKEAVSRGSLELSIRGQPVQITADMVAFETVLPEGLAEADTPFGTLFVDFRQTPEIEAEAYARELVRRVQQMRKEMELRVEDHIAVEVQASTRLVGFFGEWEEHIRVETRAERVAMTEGAPQGEHVKAWDLDGESVTIGVTKLR
ncbi:MAG: isoleucine--tRNA ligase [Thermoplasmata archaeon]